MPPLTSTIKIGRPLLFDRAVAHLTTGKWQFSTRVPSGCADELLHTALAARSARPSSPACAAERPSGISVREP